MGMTIGLFDSGLGGITILRHLQKTFPNVNYIYVADYAYNPYGTKEYKVIEARVKKIYKFLEKQCDIVVIACNTASIHINSIKSQKDIYGVIKPTAEYAMSKSLGHIGVFATNKTIEDGSYQRLIEQNGFKVTAVPASEFVDIVESNRIDDETSKMIYEEKMSRLKDVDTIVLGCTHFELILHKLKEIDNTKTYITSGKPISDLLKEKISREDKFGETKIYLTKESKNFYQMVDKLRINHKSIKIINIE